MLRKIPNHVKVFLIPLMSLVFILSILIAKDASAGTGPAASKYPENFVTPIKTDSTDQTSAMRSAIARAEAGSGILQLDSGVIVLTDSIQTGVEIRGNNTRIKFEGSPAGFRLMSGAKLIGLDIEWSGSVSSGDETFGSAISAGNRTTGLEVTNGLVDNCTVKSNRQGGAGICVAGKSVVTVRNTTILSNPDSSRFGLLAKFAEDANDSTYHPIVIFENIDVDTLTPADSNGYAISLDGAYQAVVKNGKTQYTYLSIDVRPDSFGFTHAHSGNGFGPSSYPSIEIINSHFRDCWTWGARVSGSVESETSSDTVTLPVLFENCTFSAHDTTAGSGYNAQDPTGAMCRFWAMGVKFSHCSFYGFNKGMSFDEADGVVFEDCIFEGNQNSINVNSSSIPDNIEIRRCKVRDIAASGEIGILIGRAGHVILEGNTLGRLGDKSIKYGIAIRDDTGLAQVKMIGNHVDDLMDDANAQAYRVDSIANVYLFLGNTIDTANVPVARFSKNTNISSQWKKREFLGFELPDSSATYANTYLLGLVIAGGDTSWTMASPSAGSTDSILTVQYAHVSDSLALALLKSGGQVTGDIIAAAKSVDIAAFGIVEGDLLLCDSIIIGILDSARITIDGSKNLVLWDEVTGSKTLAELSAAGSGGVWDTMSTNDTTVYVGPNNDTTYLATFGADSMKIWHSSGNVIIGNGAGLFSTDSIEGAVLIRADSINTVHLVVNGVALDADASILSEAEAAATYEALFVNEAGLYAALSDVTDFLQAADVNTSSELLAIVGDETGTGVLVFGTAPTFTTSVTVGAFTISEAEAGYVDGVTSDIQTQIDGKETALTDKASLESTLSDVSDVAEADGDTYTGAHDFGGATSVEIPNGANPTTDADGETAYDSDDEAYETYSSDEGESVLIPIFREKDMLLMAPDGVNDEVCVFQVNTRLYPHGIEIDSVAIQLPADAAYSMVIEEWSGADPPVYQNAISTVTTGASDTRAVEAPDTDGAIDAGDNIYLDIPATDVDWIHVKIIFHVTEGD